MFNLTEFKAKRTTLADLLPWGALLAPGTLVNKDGSFQATLRFRGPDIDSATEAERINLTAYVNQALMSLGAGWAIYVETRRCPSADYPSGRFTSALACLIDRERAEAFQDERTFQSEFYLTLQYLPPSDRDRKLEDYLVEGSDTGARLDRRNDLGLFREQVGKFLGLVEPFLNEILWLDDGETLTYLHSTISTKSHEVTPPDIPFYIDSYLADTPLLSGLRPKLGGQYLQMVSVKSFPAEVYPQVLDALNSLAFPFRQVTRFIFMSKDEALREVETRQRAWYAGRKSILALVGEALFHTESRFQNMEAIEKTDQLDNAKLELGSGQVAYGYMTCVAVAAHEDLHTAEERAAAIEQVFNVHGFPTCRESINAVEAWLGSIPGIARANVRRPMISSVALSRIMPTSAVWPGQNRNHHLNGPALFRGVTSGSTPFDYSTHVGDIGHTLIIGPTGSGKSTLLAFMALQFERYAEGRVVFFDKGASIKAATLGVGGAFVDLGDISAASFQPLRNVDEEQERLWAADWILMLLTQENLTITPHIKEQVYEALLQLAERSVEHRTITSFMTLIQDQAVRDALRSYSEAGAFGHLLDAADSTFALAHWQAFEMEEIMKMGRILPPVLGYLFHAIERNLDAASPTMIVIDEAWVFLENPYFESVLREWLKVLRKKNAFVVFATQNLADFAESRLGPVVAGNVATRIYLPNPDAGDPASRRFYEEMGLNERQVELIATSVPKRDYYVTSPLGNRLFELGLSDLALAFCGASGDSGGEAINKALAAEEPFLRAYLSGTRLDWAVEALDEIEAETNEGERA